MTADGAFERLRTRVLAPWRSAVAVVLLLVTASPAAAQQRCYFLECPTGQVPGRAPALPALPTVTPQAIPKGSGQKAAARPTRSGEVCQASGAITYCASSVLSPQQGNTYVPANMVDGRLDTAWVEGRAGDGVGEWVVADFDALRRIRSVQVMNGYHKNEDLFAKNNRMRDIELGFSDGTSRTFTLADRGGIQVFQIDQTIYSSWVQLTIRSVYKGTKFADTALTEFRVETSD